MTGANLLREEWPDLLGKLVQNKELSEEQIKPFRHLNIVGLVGSIDNDMCFTDATIGCYSSLGRICEAIDSIHTTASSHQRAFVIEVMGRHCGWLALCAGVSTGADFVFLPEQPPTGENGDWRKFMGTIIQKHRELGKRKTVVIVAEGAQDLDLNPIKPSSVVDFLKKELKLDTRLTTLGHVQRGGNASAFDRYLSTMQGVEAVKAVLDATPETLSPVIMIKENKLIREPLMEAVKETKLVAEAIKAKRFDEAMRLRGPEFKEYYDAYMVTTSNDRPDLLLPEGKRMRIAFIHVGAPAGGMNAATRGAVAYCLARGHTPIAIHNGFPGLQRHHDDKPLGSVREMTWLEVDDWVQFGGSEIGTNRDLPSADYETTAKCFDLYKFDGKHFVLAKKVLRLRHVPHALSVQAKFLQNCSS